MPKPPNAHRVVIDPRKLTEYALNPDHRRGRDKARVFAAVLGVTAEDADWLADRPRQAACEREAVFLGNGRFGRLYRIDFPLRRGDRRATIRSFRIVRADETFPRLTTCFVREDPANDFRD